MVSSVTKNQVLLLYKTLLRESQKFSNYNFRSYALRRIKDAFKTNKSLTDNKQAVKQLEHGKESLEMIKRQVIIGEMYKSEKLVIENIR